MYLKVKLTYLVLLTILLQLAGSSCQHVEPRIVHMDFCDFLNSPPGDSTKPVIQEKSIHYFVDANDAAGLTDSLFSGFIKRDSLIRKEVDHGYYRLNVSFYGKSPQTEALMRTRSDKNLDYCQNDLLREYQWVEGKYKGYYLFKGGVIQGTEGIQLEKVK